MAGTDVFSSRTDLQLDREWLVTNGIGGFAASTVPGLNTRKYHGLLIAAMTPPSRQMVILSRVEDSICSNGQSFPLASCEYPGIISPPNQKLLKAFNHDPFPRWAYQGDDWTIEKEVRLLHGENTVCVTYSLLGGRQPVELMLRPMFALRGMHQLMYQWNGRLLAESLGVQDGIHRHRIAATGRTPEAFFAHDGCFHASPDWYLNTIYRREVTRGYAGLEDVWTPGEVRWTLQPGQTVQFICSTEPIDVEALRQPSPLVERHQPCSPFETDRAFAALCRAADQFIVYGKCQTADRSVEPAPQIVAGYPWMPDSGRDALIALPGLLLTTRRFDEARLVLAHYASRERHGLITAEPASAPTVTRDCLPADVSLWFVNACWQFLQHTSDVSFVLSQLLPTVQSILRHFTDGATEGVQVDAGQLVHTGEPGTASTWMDAQLGEWVVTPRHGCAVEVNALWFNALNIAAALEQMAGDEAAAAGWYEASGLCRRSFNLRFWNDEAECCFDVIGDARRDAAIRPNQIFAVSLPFAVLDLDRHASMLQTVRRELLTPFGLRTLSPTDPNYHARYTGNVVDRDQAYHQGPVFPWLLGSYITAMVKTGGAAPANRQKALDVLKAPLAYLNGNGQGQICELFDGDSPHHPGGLRASARSVGEILRCYAEDILEQPVVRMTTAISMHV